MKYDNILKIRSFFCKRRLYHVSAAARCWASTTRKSRATAWDTKWDTQRQLLADYNEDIRKYAQGLDQGRILNVFEHIPIQLAKDNKKFQISKVASGARFKEKA